MRLLILISLTIITITSFGQQTINGTIMHGGIVRSYILYVPASYNSATAAPVVFNFHGYTSNASQQIAYGEFRLIADTAGFLLVVPQGTIDIQGNTYWNANWGGTVDDVGFTEALLDDLSITYTVNQDRVYSTGMSNGGFMSYHLACNLSNRIAAIASVTGAMTLGTPNTCSPQNSMPILEIHGDADGTVSYSGTAFSESVQNGLDYWVNYNNNNTTPVFTMLPNISTSDNSTVEHYVYTNGDNCVEVEHYKVINGGHTWPGAAFNTGNGTTNQDINASELIWNFFLKYDVNGEIGCVITNDESFKEVASNIKVYPNPTNNVLNVLWENNKISAIRLVNVLGVEIQTFKVIGGNQKVISTEGMSKGIYFIEMLDQNRVVSISKVVVD
jgi:polyhydroxybutyrate depolymerase